MQRLICALAALVLTDCSAVAIVPTQSRTQPAALPDRGGTFSVNESGKYSGSGCGPFGPGNFSFMGSGDGTFIHSNKESGDLSSPKFSCTFSGHATMVSDVQPSNSITMALRSSKPPCLHFQSTTISFTITGGTGRFTQATGSGNVVIRCSFAKPGTYSDQWSGTIKF